jgi:LmbE family N-acetylglucosaminyl deacetylase
LKAFDITVKRWLFCFTHPDDEISIVAWIKRLCDAGANVYCAWTVSNPIREEEARAMMKRLGVPHENLFFFDAPDGDACEHLGDLIEFETRVIDKSRPDRIALGAFECGHIDHDSTNVAVAHANAGRVPMFEIPFYHTYLTKVPVINRFADPTNEEVIELTPSEQRLKVVASRSYKSQNIGSLLFWYTILGWAKFSPVALCRTERMRLQSHFDFTSPNLPDHRRKEVIKSAKFERFVAALKTNSTFECNSSVSP